MLSTNVSLLLWLALVRSVGAEFQRTRVAFPVAINVKMLGIAESEVSIELLENFLSSMLPVSDIARRDKGDKQVDVDVRFKYTVTTASTVELSDYDTFIRQQHLDGDNYYHVTTENLEKYLGGLRQFEPTFQSFTVLLVHSKTLARHVIYTTNPNTCIQTYSSNVLLLDMSSKSCHVKLPTIFKDPYAHVQYNTPIYNHPWPGTFAPDATTLWGTIPTSALQNHRIARIGGVIISAARTFGSTNYLDISVDVADSFLIPILCFHRGDATSGGAPKIPMDKIQRMLDEILPEGHKGRALMVSYGVDDVPESAIAVSVSRRDGKALYKETDKPLLYPYLDGNVMWDRLSATVSKITGRMLHALRISSSKEGKYLFDESTKSYPIVILSDYIEAGTSIAPMFSDGGLSHRVNNGEALLVLHSSDIIVNHFLLHDDGIHGSVIQSDISGQMMLFMQDIAHMVSGLRAPELQQHKSFKSIDITWYQQRNETVEMFFNPPPVEGVSYVSVWSARRGVLLSKLNRILVSANDLVEKYSSMIARLKSLENVSAESAPTLSDLLGDELKEFIFPGLREASALFPILGKQTLPEAALQIFRNIGASLEAVQSSIRQIEGYFKGDHLLYSLSFNELKTVHRHINNMQIEMEKETEALVSILRSCTVSYDFSLDKPKVSRYSFGSNNSEIFLPLSIGVGVVVLLVFIIYRFQKFVEQKAKKLA